jgi:hypothetical protein
VPAVKSLGWGVRHGCFGLLWLLVLAACTRAPPDGRRNFEKPKRTSELKPEIRAALATLRREEAELRARTDFSTLAPSSRAFGANPYALAVLPGAPPRAVGILRGDSRVVVLDAALATTSSLAAPELPSAVGVSPTGQVFVVGSLERRIARYRVGATGLTEESSIQVPNARALRALAVDARTLVVADFARDFLFVTTPASDSVEPRPTCAGPFRLALSARFLAVGCLFDHAVVLLSRSADGTPAEEVARIVHDGPIWSLALLERGDTLFVGAGGVEDRPLARADKVFGHVDSFVFMYTYAATHGLKRLGDVNVSELGVVTPKSVSLRFETGALTLDAYGYATDRSVSVRFDASAPAATPVASTRAGLPGCSDVIELGGRNVCANPLFDAWASLGSEPRVHPARPDEPRDPNPRERLGEALFFTTLMAPDAKSEGRLSRFTCETCHFEGGSDGRVHDSGRDGIRVSTRLLFGLANAGPHFSRAHDPDLTSVCHNEFTVANRGNPVDPWFELDAGRFGWLRALGTRQERVPAVELRTSLGRFLMRFTHEENPYAYGRVRSFSQQERRGAESFRDRCASCHAARLVASDARSEVPFDRWERLVFAPEAPIVWSDGSYARTGVEPYVDRRGTRVPSLRRLYLKRPYLTNGGAIELEQLLWFMRFTPNGTRHLSTAADVDARAVALGVEERTALLSFLRLL